MLSYEVGFNLLFAQLHTLYRLHIKYLLSVFTADCLRHTVQMLCAETIMGLLLQQIADVLQQAQWKTMYYKRQKAGQGLGTKGPRFRIPHNSILLCMLRGLVEG